MDAEHKLVWNSRKSTLFAESPSLYQVYEADVHARDFQRQFGMETNGTIGSNSYYFHF